MFFALERGVEAALVGLGFAGAFGLAGALALFVGAGLGASASSAAAGAGAGAAATVVGSAAAGGLATSSAASAATSERLILSSDGFLVPASLRGSQRSSERFECEVLGGDEMPVLGVSARASSSLSFLALVLTESVSVALFETESVKVQVSEDLREN
jgi:hypothetical protein